MSLSTKSELLFYLVTCFFAQCLCHGRRQNFALEFQQSPIDPDEQVPKYPAGTLQVPYNQQLGQ
jgi:hypothetical protein